MELNLKIQFFTLKILSLAIPFLFNAASIMLTSLNKQDVVSRMLKYVAAVSIFLNLLLGYYFKVTGTAVATVLTLFIIFIISHFAVKKHTKLGIGHSISSYQKGIEIFCLCWWLHDLLMIKFQIAAILATTVIFVFLNFMLFLTKDDFRIVFEILNIRKNKPESID